ncbi:MAG: mannitol/fructose-specific phosphotransferase system IIA component (Ntr-type) [Glaciecola sp.]|jgi:mannitol/fructose-specific phosphotransferase system IIA component (Ntr-type)
MNLGELFEVKNLVVGFEPLDKWHAIEALIQHLVDTGSLQESQAEDALDAVQRRERSMSTGMEKGVAIPHAALPDLDHVIAILGVVSREGGVPFESMDGGPAQLIVVLLIPKEKKLLHIRTLADVARILGDATVREAILNAPAAQTVHNLLASASA